MKRKKINDNRNIHENCPKNNKRKIRKTKIQKYKLKETHKSPRRIIEENIRKTTTQNRKRSIENREDKENRMATIKRK